jgi:Family of unknown function (DUF6252)
MKNLKTLAILLVSVIITSCSKSDEPEPTPAPLPTVNGSVTATIDGGSFSASALVNISYVNTVLTVQGTDTFGKSIQIQLTAPGTGTYNLYGNVQGSATYNPGLSALGKVYSSIGCNADLPQTGFTPNGTITITSLTTPKIEGTFQFKCAEINSCADQKVVTAGAFSKNL